MGKPSSFRRLRTDYETVMERAPSLQAAAGELGVDRRTLHRWIRRGMVQKPPHWRRLEVVRPSATPANSAHVQSLGAERQPDERLEDWARRALSLSGPEWDLLRQAQMAADLADDMAQPPMVRLAASGRYQSLAKQLRFPVEDE